MRGRLVSIALLFLCTASGAQEVHRPKIDLKDTAIFTAVEKRPQFPGGEGALLRYIAKKLNPKFDEGEVIQYSFIVSVIVEKDGSISNAIVEKPLHTKAEEQLIKVLVGSPKWYAAVHKGYIVRCKYSFPLHINWNIEQ